jgi:hypothetical protein
MAPPSTVSAMLEVLTASQITEIDIETGCSHIIGIDIDTTDGS